MEINYISLCFFYLYFFCRVVPLRLSEEADSGTQQTHHPARGHSPYRAPCTRSQGRLSCQYSTVLYNVIHQYLIVILLR
jgi:hypothetical protein